MIYRFDAFELDEGRYELRRIDGVEPSVIEVQPKVIEVLFQLVRNAERTLTKDELLESVWGDLAITEASLTRCVSLARRALGEHEGEPRIIKTVRGRGYALGVAVHRLRSGEPEGASGEAVASEEAASTPGRRPRRLAFGLLGATALLLVCAWLARPFEPGLVTPPAPPLPEGPSAASVAVLPFHDLRSPDGRSLEADGLVYAVIEQLARRPELRVTSPSSSFRFDPTAPLDPSRVGDELGVGTLVLGTVRPDATGESRLLVEAVEASSGFQRWAARFPLSDTTKTDGAIASRVAEALGAEADLDPLRPGVASVEAFELLIRGQQAVLAADRERVFEAIGIYERALEADPDNVRAYVALGEVYLLLWLRDTELGAGDLDWRAASEASLLEALERAPRDPDALSAFGQLEVARRNWDAAEAYFERALESGGGARPSSRMAGLQMMRGRLERARPHAARALRLDPLGNQSLRMAGRLHLYAGELDLAVAHLRRAVELEPRTPYSTRLLANAYYLSGDMDAGRETYYRIVPGWARPLARLSDRVIGSEATVRGLLEADIAWTGHRCRRDAHGTALAWALLQDGERMLECLDLAAEHHLFYARLEPLLDPYRDDERFQAIMRKAGF